MDLVGIEEDVLQVHRFVASVEEVAQVAEFPAGKAIDHQHVGAIIRDRALEIPSIVVVEEFSVDFLQFDAVVENPLGRGGMGETDFCAVLILRHGDDFFPDGLFSGHQPSPHLEALEAVQFDFGSNADAIPKVNRLRRIDPQHGRIAGADRAAHGHGANGGSLGTQLPGGVLGWDLTVVAAVAQEQHPAQSFRRDFRDRVFQGSGQIGALPEARGIRYCSQGTSLEPGVPIEITGFMAKADKSNIVTFPQGLDHSPVLGVLLQQSTTRDLRPRLGGCLVDRFPLGGGEVAVVSLVELGTDGGKLAQHHGKLIIRCLQLRGDGQVIVPLNLAADFIQGAGHLFLKWTLQILELAGEVGIGLGGDGGFAEGVRRFREMRADRFNGAGEAGGSVADDLFQHRGIGSGRGVERLALAGEFRLPGAGGAESGLEIGAAGEGFRGEKRRHRHLPAQGVLAVDQLHRFGIIDHHDDLATDLTGSDPGQDGLNEDDQERGQGAEPKQEKESAPAWWDEISLKAVKPMRDLKRSGSEDGAGPEGPAGFQHHDPPQELPAHPDRGGPDRDAKHPENHPGGATISLGRESVGEPPGEEDAEGNADQERRREVPGEKVVAVGSGWGHLAADWLLTKGKCSLCNILGLRVVERPARQSGWIWVFQQQP